MLLKDRPYFVYFLRCPETEEIRYVGISCHPERRYREHLSTKDSSHKSRWIAKLKPLVPLLYVAGPGTLAEMVELEKEYISILPNLTNIKTGGEGGFYITEEANEKRLDALRSSIRTPEYRKRKGEIMREKFKDPVVRQKHLDQVREASKKPAYKKKQSDGSKAMWANPEIRSKITDALKSPERVKRASDISKELWEDPEYRALQKAVRPKNGFYNVPVERSDGRVYPNVKSAAEDLGIHYTSISKHLSGKTKKVKGFTFKRVA